MSRPTFWSCVSGFMMGVTASIASFQVLSVYGDQVAAISKPYFPHLAARFATQQTPAKSKGAAPASEKTAPKQATKSDNRKEEVVLAAGDAQKGKAQFKKCAACHSVEANGKAKVGPNLWTVMDRPIASSDGFKYSKAFKKQTGTWTDASMDRFLASPRSAVPGTRMSFAGLKKADERANIVAYLKSLTGVVVASASNSGKQPQKEVKKLDPEKVAYGEYLSGECTSCHRRDGGESKIPSIVGWKPDTFTDVMQSFRDGTRKNPAMVSVVKSLEADQIEALAFYFSTLEKK